MPRQSPLPILSLITGNLRVCRRCGAACPTAKPRRGTIGDTPRTQTAESRDVFRALVLLGMLLAYGALVYVFRFVLQLSSIYSHLLYIPILIAAIWWGRGVIVIAIAKILETALLHLSGAVTTDLYVDIGRAAAVLLVGLAAGEMGRSISRTRERLRDAERKAAEANRQLRSLSSLQRDFLKIAVHDLRSPVNTSISLVYGLESVMEKPLTEQQVHLLGRLRDRLGEVSSFLHDFQVLAMLDSSEDLRSSIKTVDVGAILAKVVEELSDRSAMKGQNVELDVPPHLPSIQGIAFLVREAVGNLLANAIKYTPEGGRIEVRARSGDGSVLVQVEDNGPGISPEDQDRLFEEFVRIRASAGKSRGSGLGLSIVKRAADVHGGDARVDSVPGEGSTFTLELPLTTEGDL